MANRQHEPLRVPQGWNGQDRALVIQIEKLFSELYNIAERLGRLIAEIQVDLDGKADKATTVTAVTWDDVNKKITLTINGDTSDVVTVAQIKQALGGFTHGELAGE